MVCYNLIFYHLTYGGSTPPVDVGSGIPTPSQVAQHKAAHTPAATNTT